MTAALAKRFGTQPAGVVVNPFHPRSLEAFAMENALEGCVKETCGAAVAAWQAAHAGDAEVRRAMYEIASDEADHAELAWDIAAWAEPALDPAARLRVEVARREAIQQRSWATGARQRDLIDVAGMPTEEQVGRIMSQLEAHIWSERV